MYRCYYYFFLILLFNSYIIAALNPIVIKGQKFFDSVSNDQFFIKGVAYQPKGDDTTSDPLANPEACTRDAPLIKDLGANVIRVYQVDPTKNHDICMETFANNGLYVLLGISTPEHSINRDHPEYDVSMYNAYRSTVSTFATYPHVLGFIAGNEVANSSTNTPAASYVKAVIRDIKALMGQNNKSVRAVPVGYATNDDVLIRDNIKNFFVCGDNVESHADFLGLNLYEWCGAATFESSGYAARTKEFEAYGRPVFLSEYGCNDVQPRVFGEVEAIYGSQMTTVWSGGVAYEWTQENGYGLVKISNSGKVEPLTDYHNLHKVLRNADPKGITMDNYQVPKTIPIPPCPVLSNNWEASTILPPTPSEEACQCMKENLSCVLSDSINDVIVGRQLDIMCGLVSCQELNGKEKNQTDGKYGAFSFCNSDIKLSWLYNSYVTQTNTTCSFDSYARSVLPKRKDIDICSSIKPNMSINPIQNNSSISNLSIFTTYSLSLPLVIFIIYFICI